MEKLTPFLNRLSYSGKCNDYDSKGDLDSPIFKDATDMAGVVEGEDVVSLSLEQFESILRPREVAAKGDLFQINLKEGVAWVYNTKEDIHYFYSF